MIAQNVWKMECSLEPYIPPNDPPSIIGISAYYSVEPMKQTIIKLGELIDVDEDQRSIKSMTVTPTVQWLRLVQKVNDPSVGQVDLSVVPPNLAINQTYSIRLELTEIGVDSPETNIHEFKLFVQ